MSALEVFKNKQSALQKIGQARDATRTAVNGIEIVLGSAASGYVSKQIGEVAGIPADVAIGLVGLGIGLGMRQRDVTALSVGFLAGYARDFGASLATVATP
jgi:hypothetical protein